MSRNDWIFIGSIVLCFINIDPLLSLLSFFVAINSNGGNS